MGKRANHAKVSTQKQVRESESGSTKKSTQPQPNPPPTHSQPIPKHNTHTKTTQAVINRHITRLRNIMDCNRFSIIMDAAQRSLKTYLASFFPPTLSRKGTLDKRPRKSRTPHERKESRSVGKRRFHMLKKFFSGSSWCSVLKMSSMIFKSTLSGKGVGMRKFGRLECSAATESSMMAVC